MEVQSRIALIGILIEEESSVEPVNQTLHDYRSYIVGRMGIPYRQKNVNIISVVLDAPADIISTLSGKLGMIDGITVKSMFTKKKYGEILCINQNQGLLKSLSAIRKSKTLWHMPMPTKTTKN